MPSINPLVLRSGDADSDCVIALDLPLEPRLELGQMPIAFDPVQARFDSRRCGHMDPRSLKKRHPSRVRD